MLQVAAYCRVSTDHEDQIHSLENQKRYFEEYIQGNPLWQLTKIYADEGITGTSVQKRQAFQQMIRDAQRGCFKLLLTKEISRFARNTLDSIYYTRLLKQWGVGVIFLRDNINTLDPDAELRLTILSSIAQEESRKTSDRVKWGQKRRMEQGVVFGRSMLGYDVKDGQLFVNEEGARIVRLIFHLFVTEGKGTHTIAKELQQAGVPTYHGLAQWSNTAVLRALRNEKYCGDLIQKKTYTPDYLTHQKRKNLGEEPLVILHDHHPPIISRALWQQAQEELKRRGQQARQRQSRYSCRYCFSGKLYCGFCGSPFVCRRDLRKDGEVHLSWRCREASCHGRMKLNGQGDASGCLCRQISHQVLLEVMAQLLSSLEPFQQNIDGALRSLWSADKKEQSSASWQQPSSPTAALLSKRRLRLLEAYLDGEVPLEDYRTLSQRYEQELQRLETARKQKSVSLAGQPLSSELISTARELLQGRLQKESFYQALLDRITIYDRFRMDVYLKGMDQPLHITLISSSANTLP